MAHHGLRPKMASDRQEYDFHIWEAQPPCHGTPFTPADSGHRLRKKKKRSQKVQGQQTSLALSPGVTYARPVSPPQTWDLVVSTSGDDSRLAPLRGSTFAWT